MKTEARPTPAWAEWAQTPDRSPYTVGLEEELMLLDEESWNLAHRIETVLPGLQEARNGRFTAETHGSALEIQTGLSSGASRAPMR